MALARLIRQLLPNLTKLELDEVGFDSQVLASLCTGAVSIKLQELSFIGECLVDYELLPTLGQLQHLRVLRLDGCLFEIFGEEYDVTPLARLMGLQELHLNVDDSRAVGLNSVLSACTQLRVLTLQVAHHITPELHSLSLIALNILCIVMSEPFLLNVERMPSLRSLHVVRMFLCSDAEHVRLPQTADIVERNAHILASLPAAVEFGWQNRSELPMFEFVKSLAGDVAESGGVVQALLGRLRPLTTLPAARGLH